MTVHNVIILIKSVWNLDKNKYCYNIFLEKASYKLPKNDFLCKILMLYYDRIDASERIHINKTSASKECDICRYWYFLNEGFKFQTYVCNRCHDLLMMSINLSDITILKIKNADYCCIITEITISEAIKLLQNINLTEKSRTL